MIDFMPLDLCHVIIKKTMFNCLRHLIIFI